MRTNGFQRPLNGMQITTWIILPFLLLQFLLCLTPTLPKVIGIPLTIIFILSAMTATWFGYITTKTDSIDHLLHQHIYGSPHPQDTCTTATANNANNSGAENDETKYCWVCQTNVKIQSMHCKYCDKCVSNFDHHCMWLNTCIGSSNYGTFFQTIVWTFIFVFIHVVTLTVHLSLYFCSNDTVRRLASNWLVAADSGDVGDEKGSNMILVGINIAFLVFTAFCAFMILQLLVFHFGLKRENITTYEYILRDSARKRDKMQLTNKVRQRRTEELQKAGNAWQAFVLKAGSAECFRSCDPVRKLVLQEMDQDESRQSIAEEESYSNGISNGAGVSNDSEEKKEESKGTARTP